MAKAKGEEMPAFIKETKKDILDVLRNVKSALDERDSKELIEWSNHLIHTVTLSNEPRALYVSIIAYSLGKLIGKESAMSEHKEEWDEFLEGISSNIDAAIKFLDRDDMRRFDDSINAMMKLISEFDASFSRYVQEVLEFSRVQKGAKVYEHGLSLASVAKMVGISQWALMQKVGETTIHEHRALITKSPKERFEEVKRIMKKRD